MDKIRAKLIQQTKWAPCAILAALVRAIVLKGHFWHCCQNYVHMVEDVLKALQVFHGHGEGMAYNEQLGKKHFQFIEAFF
jgi:hypothetical protein